MFIAQPFVLGCGCAALLLLAILRGVFRASKSPIRSVPGPWYTHFSHYVLKFYTLTGQRMHYVHGLHETYGPIVRISPKQVAVADPDGFAAIHRIGAGFVKTQWYEDFLGGANNVGGIGVGIFAMINPKEHAQRRKLFARAFSVASLRENCEEVVREKIDRAVSRTHAEASTGVADIFKWWMLMTSDVIGQLAFGESFESLEAGKKSEYIQVLETAALGMTLQYELPWLYQLCRYIPLRSVQRLMNAASLVNAYGGRAVANLYRHSDNRANLFSNMLAETESLGKSLLSDDSIRREASNLIVAGADTTSNTLTYVIWSILKRPHLHSVGGGAGYNR